MEIKVWGTRGSLPTPGPETERYGGNTSCVEVNEDGWVLALDAGTGLRRMGMAFPREATRVDILLTHLHMDHIQGLGFFFPLFNPKVEVHIYGPVSATLMLRERLARYLSPPLFPVHLRDLPSLYVHEVPRSDFDIGPFRIHSELVCHPDPTVGYRLTSPHGSLAYMPDHEPALGLRDGFLSPDWTSGYGVAREVDLLIHDAQYTTAEYPACVGWGHSTFEQAFEFARMAEVRTLMPFHHDPGHDDDQLDKLLAETIELMHPQYAVEPAREGLQLAVGSS